MRKFGNTKVHEYKVLWPRTATLFQFLNYVLLFYLEGRIFACTLITFNP